MCAIAGLVGYPFSDVHPMLARMHHRGPDHLDIQTVPGTTCHLGHLRLSILDLDPRSHQPFRSGCGRYSLVFNGEIYNYQQLRSELQARGTHFRTSSDTEVLLHWLIEFGVSGLPRLDGMFAFAFADSIGQTMLLARDPIGEKPLYYSAPRDGGRFSFASEIKALLTLQGIDHGLDREALRDFLRFAYTAAPRTLYRGIRELPPGHCLEVRLSAAVEVAARPYYFLERSVELADEVSPAVAAERFAALFEQSVRLRLVSDTDIGLFLSAGMDSNAILAAARKSGRFRELHTYTLAYSTANDESKLVRSLTAKAGLSNVTIPFDSLDLQSSVTRMVDLFDQPFGNSTAVVSDLIARAAVRTCKVCLVGDGGDEIAVGYPRYHALPWLQTLRRLPRAARSMLSCAASRLPESGRFAVSLRRGRQFLATSQIPLSEAFLDWSTYLNTQSLQRALGVRDVRTSFYDDLLATFERHSSDPIRAATLVDMKSFVPFNLMQSGDRTSMAHSLEVRNPFLATPLVHAMLGLPSSARTGSGSKPMIRAAFAHAMAPEVLVQRKRPFNPPIRELLRKNVEPLRDRLVGQGSRLHGLVEPQFVRDELDAFVTGRRDNSTFLWGLATLDEWLGRTA